MRAAPTVTTTPEITLPAAEEGTVTTPPPRPATAPVRPAQVAASATAGSGQNSCGDVTTYDAAYTFDGDTATGWRVKGDGAGASLTYTFAGPTRLGQVGLLPGYAKVDPCSQTDRFRQLRRVVRVRWTFADGTSVEQSFAEDPSVQLAPVDVVTTTVRLEILATTAGPDLDYTALSEVSFLGAPA